MLKLQLERPLFKYLRKIFRKIVLVLTSFTLITIASKKIDMVLEKVSYINYLLYFRKNTVNIRALINLSNKINAMTPAYINKLGLKTYYTNIGVQKIDSSTFETFGMVLASFQMKDKPGQA